MSRVSTAVLHSAKYWRAPTAVGKKLPNPQ